MIPRLAGSQLTIFLLVLLVYSSLLATRTISAFSVRPLSRLTLRSFDSLPHTCLFANKLWDRLQIEEDEEPVWYLINCVATQEIDLLRQCRQVCDDMPDAVKFVVPTERKTRSHGANRMVTETKVKYPGYVFGKLRLCPQVYEAIQELDLCRSWMGTVNHKGYKKLPPCPQPLNELEVEKFGLEECDDSEEDEDEDFNETIIVDTADQDDIQRIDQAALKVFQGLKVEDMVKVTAKGKFFDEDGIVRRLKDGKILVRFYTYGTMFEEWMDPGDLRKLSAEEILRGLSGPSQPVTQQDFDGPRDYGRSFDDSRPGDLRRSLGGNLAGGDRRNRRQDRVAGRFNDNNRNLSEERKNEANWNWYKDQQEQGRGTTASDEDFRMRRGSKGGYDEAEGDVDSQWGRFSKRQQRRDVRTQPDGRRVNNNRRENRVTKKALDGSDDWSSFVSPSSAPATGADDFFDSLVSGLSNELERNPKKARSDPKGQSEDDFFASLMSELSEETKRSSNDARATKAPKQAAGSSSDDDDFFAALEGELTGALETSPKGKASTVPDEDDFFASLEKELNQDLGDAPQQEPPKDKARNNKSQQEPVESSDDAFFASLANELDSDLDVDAPAAAVTATTKTSKPKPQQQDSMEDFYASLERELKSLQKEISVADGVDNAPVVTEKKTAVKPKSPPAAKAAPADASSSSSSASSLSKCTVPVLKEMLRERGLKVSGKKAELIERLTQS